MVGYRCLAAPWVNRLASLLLGVFSVMLVWSEATIGIGSHDLSPFSHVSPAYCEAGLCLEHDLSAWALAVHCVLALCTALLWHRAAFCRDCWGIFHCHAQRPQRMHGHVISMQASP